MRLLLVLWLVPPLLAAAFWSVPAALALFLCIPVMGLALAWLGLWAALRGDGGMEVTH